MNQRSIMDGFKGQLTDQECVNPRQTSERADTTAAPAQSNRSSRPSNVPLDPSERLATA